MAEILLVRHGQASFGSADYDCLSPLGQQQGRWVGEYLWQTGLRPDALYSGSLLRQQQTAEAVRAVFAERQHDLPVLQIEPGFNEVENGEQVQLMAPAMAATDPQFAALLARADSDKKAFQKVLKQVFKAWQLQSDNTQGLQTWGNYQAAALAALGNVMQAQGSGKTVLVFTSGGTIATLVAHALGMPDSAVYDVFEPVINASITRLLYSGQQVSLSSYNEHSYLAVLAGRSAISYR